MRYIVVVLITFIIFYTNPAFSSDVEEQIDMEFEWLQAETVQIASKSKESLFDAPSVISLITKEEIKNLNPGNLVDLINTIPGFNSHIRELGETLFQFSRNTFCPS